MMQTMFHGDGTINVQLEAEKVQQDAGAFLKAHKFLTTMKDHSRELSTMQMSFLRRIALSGDIDEAENELRRMLEEGRKNDS